MLNDTSVFPVALLENAVTRPIAYHGKEVLLGSIMPELLIRCGMAHFIIAISIRAKGLRDDRHCNRADLDAVSLSLCLAEILSGANAFEISDIQEGETEAVLRRPDPK